MPDKNLLPLPIVEQRFFSSRIINSPEILNTLYIIYILKDVSNGSIERPAIIAKTVSPPFPTYMYNSYPV
jgi:hypothetical protein